MDEFFMKIAIEEAQIAYGKGEAPVGCAIVYENEIAARTHNMVRENSDPTAHAEVLAIRLAAKDGFDLTKCTMYVTLEPCPMCAGAIVMSKVRRLVYGARDLSMGCAGSVYRIPEDEAFNWLCTSDGGVLEEECSKLMSDFFKLCREMKR